MNNLNQKISFLVILLFLFVLIQPILAQPVDPLAELEAARVNTGLIDESPATIVGSLIKSALGLMGVVLLVFFTVGGFMWMTSAGNEEKIKKARAMIGAAIIGLIIVLLSYAAADFVIKGLKDVAQT